MAVPQNQPLSYNVNDLIGRNSGLGKKEKEVLFDYIKNGEEKEGAKKNYISKLIMIFNSFFEYGFLLKSSNSSSTGGKASLNDEWADGDDSS